MVGAKGNVSWALLFILLSITLLLIFYIISPALQNFSVRLLSASELVLEDTDNALSEVQDVEKKQKIQELNDQQMDSLSFQAELFGNLFKFGWVVVLLGLGLAYFLYSRQVVELGVYR